MWTALRYWRFSSRVKGLCSAVGLTLSQEDFVREAFIAGLSPEDCASRISLAEDEDEADDDLDEEEPDEAEERH